MTLMKLTFAPDSNDETRKTMIAEEMQIFHAQHPKKDKESCWMVLVTGGSLFCSTEELYKNMNFHNFTVVFDDHEHQKEDLKLMEKFAPDHVIKLSEFKIRHIDEIQPRPGDGVGSLFRATSTVSSDSVANDE